MNLPVYLPTIENPIFQDLYFKYELFELFCIFFFF